MPKLYQNQKTGEYYTRIFVTVGNGLGRNATKQIAYSGYRWLSTQGIRVGDEISNNSYWYLDSMGWLSTKGEADEAGPLVQSHIEITPDSLNAISEVLEQLGVQGRPRVFEAPNRDQGWVEFAVDDEALTIPTATATSSAPRFMHDPSSGVYYTIVQVVCSSVTPLILPLLIKQRGALWLMRNGAVVGEEFTEHGLQLLFERRWCYLDDNRMPAW